MRQELAKLCDAHYVSLETYRKDTSAVRTPLWCAREGDALIVWTPGQSMKVRRLRRDPRARLAACNASGKRITSDWIDVSVTLHEDDASIAAARAALRRKYGWRLTLIERTLWLRGKRSSHYIALQLR